MLCTSLKWLLPCAFVLAPLCAHAQPHNLSDHVFWDATGIRQNQEWGFAGLDTIGRVADSIPFAASIGEITGSFDSDPRNNISAFVYDRFRLDTVRHFEFPGNVVHPCNLNRDSYRDAVCWDQNKRTITILLGTQRIDSFQTFAVLHGNVRHNEFGKVIIVTADFESKGVDDIVVSDYYYSDTLGLSTFGRLLLFRGGDSLSAMPSEVYMGVPDSAHVGWDLAIGHPFDSAHKYLIEARPPGVFFYPFHSPFHFDISDSVIFHTDLDSDGSYSGGFAVLDATGDHIDDFLFGHANRIPVYKGGAKIDVNPSFYLYRPVQTGSAAFGSRILDVGRVSSLDYSSIIITDPEAQTAGYFGGAVFLYNIGKGLKDSCVAYSANGGFEAYFGTQACGAGDANNDGRADFLVGRDAEVLGNVDHIGGLTLFLGSDSYSTPLAVRDALRLPSVLTLDQNFPNPASSTTDITFAVRDARLFGKTVSIKLHDLLGRELTTVYRGTVDNYVYTIRVNTARLTSGEYEYRLECGGKYVNKIMSIVH